MTEVTMITQDESHQEYEYTPLEGEREFFVAMCGGEEAYRLWCWDIMYGEGTTGGKSLL